MAKLLARVLKHLDTEEQAIFNLCRRQEAIARVQNSASLRRDLLQLEPIITAISPGNDELKTSWRETVVELWQYHADLGGGVRGQFLTTPQNAVMPFDWTQAPPLEKNPRQRQNAVMPFDWAQPLSSEKNPWQPQNAVMPFDWAQPPPSEKNPRQPQNAVMPFDWAQPLSSEKNPWQPQNAVNSSYLQDFHAYDQMPLNSFTPGQFSTSQLEFSFREDDVDEFNQMSPNSDTSCEWEQPPSWKDILSSQQNAVTSGQFPTTPLQSTNPPTTVELLARVLKRLDTEEQAIFNLCRRQESIARVQNSAPLHRNLLQLEPIIAAISPSDDELKSCWRETVVELWQCHADVGSERVVSPRDCCPARRDIKALFEEDAALPEYSKLPPSMDIEYQITQLVEPWKPNFPDSDGESSSSSDLAQLDLEEIYKAYKRKQFWVSPTLNTSQVDTL